MWRILFVLIVFVQSYTLSVAAEDALVGRVVSVHQVKNTIMIIPVGGDKELEIGFSEGRLPAEVSVGDLIRVWGEMDNTGALFRASEARSVSQGSSASDPTGVRRRLGEQGGSRGMVGAGGRGGRGGR